MNRRINMEWLIDGYNVLISHELGHDESARRRLRQRIEAHFTGRKVKATVVYDSRSAPAAQRQSAGGIVTEIYVEDADRFIVNRVRKSENPRAITVVTDDKKDIVSRIRYCRPHLKSSREFLDLISPPAPPRQRSPEKPDYETPENIERYRKCWGK